MNITNENILDAILTSIDNGAQYLMSAKAKGDYVEVKCLYGGVLLVQMDQEYGHAEYRVDGRSFRREGSACEEIRTALKDLGIRAYINNRI